MRCKGLVEEDDADDNVDVKNGDCGNKLMLIKFLLTVIIIILMIMVIASNVTYMRGDNEND